MQRVILADPYKPSHVHAEIDCYVSEKATTDG